VNGKIQHAVQATAANAVIAAVRAALPPTVLLALQAQPSEFSEASVQDSLITLM
jgi:hypothetical protein